MQQLEQMAKVVNGSFEQQLFKTRADLSCPKYAVLDMPGPSPPPLEATPNGKPTNMLPFDKKAVVSYSKITQELEHIWPVPCYAKSLGKQRAASDANRRETQDVISAILLNKKPCREPQDQDAPVNVTGAATRFGAIQHVMTTVSNTPALKSLQRDKEILIMCRPSSPRTPPGSPVVTRAPTTPPASPVKTNSTGPQEAFQHWESPAQASPSYPASDPGSWPETNTAKVRDVKQAFIRIPIQPPATDPYAAEYPAAAADIVTAQGDVLTDTVIRQAIFDQLNGIELRVCTWSRKDLRRAAESELDVSLAHKTMVVRAAVNEFCDAYNAANEHTTNEVVLSVLEEPEETTKVFKALDKLIQTFVAEPAHTSGGFEEQICNTTESRDVLKERIRFTREATRANTMAQEQLHTRMQKDSEQHQLDMQQWQQKEENTAYAHNVQVRALEEKLQYASTEAAVNKEQATLLRIKAEAVTQQLHEAVIAQYRVPSPPPRIPFIDMRTVNAQITSLPRDPRRRPKAKKRDVVAADFFGEAVAKCATNFVARGWVPRQLRLTGRGAGMSQDKRRKTGMAAAGRNAVQDAPEVQGSNGANHRGDHPSVKWLQYVAGSADAPKTWVPKISMEQALSNAHTWKMLIEASTQPSTEPYLRSELLAYEIHMVDSAKEVVEIAFKTVGAARHLTNMQETLKQVRKAGFNAAHLTREQKATHRQARLDLVDEVESIQRWISSSTQKKRKIDTASNDQESNTQRPKPQTGVDRLEATAAEEADQCICTGVQIVNSKVKHLGCSLCCVRPEDIVVQQQGDSSDGYGSDESIPSLEDVEYDDYVDELSCRRKAQ